MKRIALSFVTLTLVTNLIATPPNVVVFLADDAGWGDYSHSGNLQIETPHIDSIAENGVTLDRFYVCPVCSPTRAEFLTGRYFPRTGVRGVSTGFERLNVEEKTVADAFKAAGYATGAFGKWHNGSQWPYHPMARGFDEYFGHTAGHWGEYFDAPLESNGKMVKTKGYIVDVCTDQAMDFIRRHRDQPFFCYVPFTTPHSPWTAPAADWEKFRDLILEQKATDPALENEDHTRCALAMMANQDWNVGRILKQLTDLGLEENTMVVYFSDNGPNSHRWNGGMRGRKSSVDEGGVRSPCHLRFPSRIPGGSKVKEITGSIDLLPTLTALAGIPRVGVLPLDGRDLSPLLTRSGGDWPDRFIFSLWNGKMSVRSQTHRLDHQGRLYDMIGDPGQNKPIEDQHPEIATTLREALDDWAKDVVIPPAEKGVDPRPIQVGYREFPITMLPARDGEPRGDVKRSSSAPNCSYFVNWSSPEDRLVWNIEVVNPGRYTVTIDYTCPIDDVGAVVELAFQNASLSGKVGPGWDPPLLTNQDTLPRPPAESTMKEFRSLTLGEVELPAGRGPLTLRATDIPGQTVMDLRRLTLTLLNP
jgi:arylsulfatase A-like enzyme